MRSLTPLITLFSIISLATAAQDSTTISFTEEDNGFSEQRFIDRHENFFMTKVPTKKMIKVGYVATTYNGIGINLAFEYKIRPSWSVEGSIFTRTNQDGAGISLESWNNQFNGKALFAKIKTRWYIDMQKRIGGQKSENNFSGKYLSLAYETSLSAIQSNRARQHFSVSYGFQSRFLAHGFLDFSLGLYYLMPYWSNIDNSYIGPISFNIRNVAFASRGTMGVAFGDWKRAGSGPLCDVLHCDYYVRQHFKIKLPEASIGIYKAIPPT